MSERQKKLEPAIRPDDTPETLAERLGIHVETAREMLAIGRGEIPGDAYPPGQMPAGPPDLVADIVKAAEAEIED